MMSGTPAYSSSCPPGSSLLEHNATLKYVFLSEKARNLVCTLVSADILV